MKLLLSVVVLFLTGAQGRSFWQQDEPSSDTRHALWKMLDGIHDIYVDAFYNLNFAKIAEEYKIKEKLEGAKDDMEKIEVIIEEYFDSIHKKYNEEIENHFPVFSKEVAPKLKKFDENLEEEALKMIREVVPAASNLYSGFRKHLHIFCGKVREIVQHAHEEIRASADELHVKVQPHLKEVQAEYEKYKEELKDGLGDKVKQAKDNFEDDVQEIVEDLRKFLEKAKENAGPRYKQLHQKVETFMEEIFRKFKGEHTEQAQQQESN